MRITFPYLGPTTAYKKVAEFLGHEVVSPPTPSQRTIDLGVKHSPEFACFPFKLIMGSYLEAIELGADTIITSGGCGPCRAGFYGEIHKRILKSMGYDIRFIVFDSAFQDFKAFQEKVRLVRNHTPIFRMLRDLMLCWRMIKTLDDFEKEIKIKRAYEIVPGRLSWVFSEIRMLFDKVYTREAFHEACCTARQRIDSVPLRMVPEEERIRIGVVGEILIAMEPTANLEVEQQLSALGAEVENVHYVSDWLRHNARPKWLGKSHAQRLIDLGARYTDHAIGGHHQENMGSMVDFKRRGFDGVVHLMPFGCLPELVTQSAVARLSADLCMPILTLSIDEQTGQANNGTRLEAFVDLVRNLKNRAISHPSGKDEFSGLEGNL